MPTSVLRPIAFSLSLLGALTGGLVYPSILDAATVVPTKQRTPASVKQAVTFDLADTDISGDLLLGTPLKLSFTLEGVPHGRVPVIAVCESALFDPHIVTLEPDASSSELRATAVLAPVAPGLLSVVPKSARIRVSFFKTPTQRQLQRILTRIVYVTLSDSDIPNNTVELFSSGDDTLEKEDQADDEEDLPPDAIPIVSDPLEEEDLLPLPDPERGQVYWRYVSSLLSRSWSRTARRVRHSPSSETVHVRFRIYPNGRAQLIEIEQGSGTREIDEAGIHAVIHAQPFPPFPEDLGSEPVTVHVRMRTGVRWNARGVRQISDHRSPRSDQPTRTRKP